MSLSKLKCDMYLHSMGIQPWSVRSPIQKRQAVIPTKNNPEAGQLLAKEIASSKISSQPTKATVEQKPSVLSMIATSEMVRFNLLFFVFSDLLIVSDLPLNERKGLSSEQSKLLQSIRLSLGYPSSQSLQSVVMVWPLIENNKIDQGEAAASEAVKAQLKKQMDKYKPKYVVLMGAAACRYVLGSDVSFDERRGQLIANEQLCAVVTYGVNELLKVPTLKSAAWQDLQVVRQLSK